MADDRNPPLYVDPQILARDLGNSLSLAATSATTPDDEAQLRAASKRLGIPLDTARANPTATKQELEREAFDPADFANRFPSSAKYLADQDNAAIARDDLAGLSNVERAIRKQIQQNMDADLKAPALERIQRQHTPGYANDKAAEREVFRTQGFAAASKLGRENKERREARRVTGEILAIEPGQVEQFFDAFGSSAKDTGASLWAGLKGADSGMAGAARAFFDTIAPIMDPLAGTVLPENPLRRVAEGIREYQEQGNAAVKALRPETTNNFSAGFHSGIESLARNLVALPLALVPGGQGPAMAMMTTPVFGEEYGKAKDKGLSTSSAIAYGGTQALIEYATEKLPLAKLIGDVKQGTPFLKTVAHQLALEVPVEQVATVLQDLNEWAYLNPEKTFNDYIEARPDAALQTLVATVVGTGGQVSVIHGLQAAADKLGGPAARTEAEKNRANRGAEQLEQLMAAAAASMTRQRAPDSFSQLVQEMAEESGSAPTELFIDARILTELVPAELLAQLPSVQAQLEEALATDGTVAIPIGEATTVFAGSGVEQELLQNVRVTEDAWTAAEAKEGSDLLAQLEQEAQSVIAEQTEAQAWEDSSNAVMDTLMGELGKAGRFTPDVNRAYATLVRDFYTVQAGKLGIMPQALYEQFPLTVSSRAPGQQSAQVLDQRTRVKLSDLPRDMLAEMFNLHATGVNPEAIERVFGMRYVDSGPLDVTRVNLAELDPIPGEQLQRYIDAGFENLPPVAIADGKLIDGQHRVQAALQAGVTSLRYVDLSGIVNPEATGYLANLNESTTTPSVTPSSKPGALKVRGVHYSSARRAALDGRFYGTGKRGAERKRLMQEPKDSPLRSRVLAYVDEGGGVKAEAGVGTAAHSIELDNIYDVMNDPLGIWTSYDPNEREHAVLAAGFDGYYMAGVMGLPDGGRQGVVALLGEAAHSVPAGRYEPAEAVLNQSVSLRDGRETLKKYGLDPAKKHKTRDVAAALEARQRKKYGTIARDDRSEEAAKKIAKWMAEEVQFELLHPEKSGVGWYSEKFQRALDTFAAEFPELETNQSARDVMTALIAITSDGQKVGPNFAQAADIYGNFRESGKFTTERQASINSNLEVLQDLHDQMGAEGMREYLLQEATVSELRKVAKEQGIDFDTAYQASVKLPMAAVLLGPKLGAFYANLMGASGYLTMDRWWSRTFNRMRGVLIQQPTPQGIARVRELLGQPDLSDDQVLAATVEHRNSYEAKNFKNGTELEKAANTVYKAAFEALEDAPFNATDRTFMLRSVALAKQLLKRRGHDISVADIQAILWYYEKRLYGELGARQSADISYEEAARQVVEQRGHSAGRSDLPGAGQTQPQEGAEGPAIGEETFGAEGEVDAQSTQGTAGDRGGRYSSGELAPLEGAPTIEGATGPDPRLVAVAEQYARDNGIPLRRQAEFVEVDPDRAARIAAAYEVMPHAPQDPTVKEAYENLILQTMAQYRALEAAGYQFFLIDETTDPYAGNPWNAMRDLRANQRMGVFATEAGFGSGATELNVDDNPLLADTGLVWPYGSPEGEPKRVLANDLFRAVHDAFGHGLEGTGFRARGEENAWQAHVRLFTGSAVAAITSETRGQNSWLNYGPHGASNQTAKVEDTIFADQKTGLLPEWAWTEGVVADEADAGVFNQSVPQTETEAFKRWFGDSKVVDAEGKPLVVYHGTPNDFSQFLPGAYFTEHPAEATAYTGAGATMARGRMTGKYKAGRDRGASDGAEVRYAYDGLSALESPKVGEIVATDDLAYRYEGQGEWAVFTDLEPDFSANAAGPDYVIVQKGDVADQAAERIAEYEEAVVGATPGGVGGGNVMPVYLSIKNPVRLSALAGNRLAEKAGNDRAYIAEQIAKWEAQGYDGIVTESDEASVVQESREGLGGIPQQWVAFRPKQIKSAIGNNGNFDPADPNILNQSGQARATFSPSTLNIALLEKADLSSFLHETGHFFFEMQATLAAQPNAPQAIVDDMQVLLNHVGYTGTAAEWLAQPVDARREAHETIAETFEQYLFTGKAPTTELQAVFRRFRSWLVAVYRSLQDFLATNNRASLNPDVVAVFDRMLASDKAIESAQAVRQFAPMFRSAEEAGMTPEAWAEYQADITQQQEEAVEQVQSRTLRDLKWLDNARGRKLKELQKEAAAQRKAIRDEVTAELNAEPIYKAMEFLKFGRVDNDGEQIQVEVTKAAKLNIHELATMYPEGELGTGADWKSLGYGKYGMLSDAGLHPDTVAEMFGFGSGRQLVAELLTVEPKAAVLAARTDQRMLERHGDISSPQAMREAANEALANEARARLVATELAAVTKATGKPGMIARAARQAADAMVAAKSVRSLRPDLAAASAARARKTAAAAMAKGDTAGAATAKRAEILQIQLERAQRKAQQDHDKALRGFKKIFKGTNEKLAKSRDLAMVNAARAVLARYGLAPNTGATQAQAYMELLADYDGQLSADIKSILQGLPPAGDFRDLTVEQFNGMRDVVNGLYYLSRRTRQMEIDGEKVDIDAIADILVPAVAERAGGEIPPLPGHAGTTTGKDKWKAAIYGAKASLTRVEFWADNMGAPFKKYIWTPVSEATANMRTQRNRLVSQYRDLLRAVEKGITYNKIDAPELGATGFTFNAGKTELLHALLHTGNRSNLTKLLLGRGWGTLNDATNELDTTKWGLFLTRMINEGVLTKADFDFAQGVWDLLETVKADAQAAHREMYGYYFNEVTADPIDTPFGQYRGGYVPALVDSLSSPDMAQKREQEDLLHAGNSFMFPTTGKGFTQSRVFFNKPLELDLRTIGMHLDKVSRFAYLEPTIKDVNQLLMNKRIARALNGANPGAISDMLTPWLQRTARQSVSMPGKNPKVNRFFNGLRNRTGMVFMFGNVVNTLQQLTGFSLAALKVPAPKLLRATQRYITDHGTMIAQVKELSPWLAERMENQSYAMQDQIEQILTNPTGYTKVVEFAKANAYFMQQAMQNVMDPIVWTGGYDHALSKNATQAEAVRYANESVRMTQGSFAPEDVAGFEVQSPFVRLFTQFYGYFNMWGNLLATEGQKTVREMGFVKGSPRLLFIWFAGMAIPAVMAELIAKGAPDDEDDEDGDGLLDEWLAFFFGAQAKSIAAMVPGLGHLAVLGSNMLDSEVYNDRLSISPALSAAESAVRGGAAVVSGELFDEELKKREVRDVLTLLGLVTGLPIAPIARAGGYAADVANGRKEPEGPTDVVIGITTGR